MRPCDTASIARLQVLREWRVAAQRDVHHRKALVALSLSRRWSMLAAACAAWGRWAAGRAVRRGAGARFCTMLARRRALALLAAWGDWAAKRAARRGAGAKFGAVLARRRAAALLAAWRARAVWAVSTQARQVPSTAALPNAMAMCSATPPVS